MEVFIMENNYTLRDLTIEELKRAHISEMNRRKRLEEAYIKVENAFKEYKRGVKK
jgi:hypothetical protein